MLFNKDIQLMEDEKTLAEYGLTSNTAKAQCPAPIGLALRYILFYNKAHLRLTYSSNVIHQSIILVQDKNIVICLLLLSICLGKTGTL